MSRACAGAAGLGRPRAQPARVGNASAPIARRPLAADAETQALLGFENDLGFIIMPMIQITRMISAVASESESAGSVIRVTLASES